MVTLSATVSALGQWIVSCFAAGDALCCGTAFDMADATPGSCKSAVVRVPKLTMQAARGAFHTLITCWSPGMFPHLMGTVVGRAHTVWLAGHTLWYAGAVACSNFLSCKTAVRDHYTHQRLPAAAFPVFTQTVVLEANGVFGVGRVLCCALLSLHQHSIQARERDQG